MSNEPLGIYDELRARADYYGELGEKLRKRLTYPRIAANGAFAQGANPFMAAMRKRIRVTGTPTFTSRPAYNYRRRTIWPEAQFGISLECVIRTVIDESEVTAGEIFGAHQTHRVSRPRQITMYMADRYCPEYSLPQIGFIFGRDHTTVMAAIDAVSIRLANRDNATVDLVTKSHARLRELAASA